MLNALATVAEVEQHAGHAEGPFQPDSVIIHHITDSQSLEIPWFKPPFSHVVKLPEIHIAGLDISITKHAVMMGIVALFLIVFFAITSRKRKLLPTGGLSNLLEMVVVFVRDEIVVKTIGEKEGKKYVPYLLTVFFFILGCNLLGLFPYAAKATGNINVTGAMAAISFVVIQVSGMIRYGFFKHFSNMIPAGIPWVLIPIMIPVELMGMFAKPFALCIRLFANMAAGHVIIVALISLIFVFNTILMAPVAVGFALFIGLLEILVALIQAYIFTMLTALFIGMTVHVAH
jgi:F-type H+-transporting ATPase subunit a